MDHWQLAYLGMRQMPRELSEFELATFFTFSSKERALIDARRSHLYRLACANLVHDFLLTLRRDINSFEQRSGLRKRKGNYAILVAYDDVSGGNELPPHIHRPRAHFVRPTMADSACIAREVGFIERGRTRIAPASTKPADPRAIAYSMMSSPTKAFVELLSGHYDYALSKRTNLYGVMVLDKDAR